jgi:hypothetical protein
VIGYIDLIKPRLGGAFFGVPQINLGESERKLDPPVEFSRNRGGNSFNIVRHAATLDRERDDM